MVKAEELLQILYKKRRQFITYEMTAKIKNVADLSEQSHRIFPLFTFCVIAI